MEAEDIAQEAMIKAYVASDRFVERHKFSTWLFKIAYNTFIDHKRRTRNYVTDIDEAVQVADEARPDDAFAYRDLYEAIDALPVKERTAILLFYINGEAVKEIAEITGSTQMAVKQRLSRGRRKLRQILER